MMISAVMIRRRNSRRWFITDMRPSGSLRRRRRGSFRRTVGSFAQATRQTELRRGEPALEADELVAQRLHAVEILRQPLGLPPELERADAEDDHGDEQRDTPHEADHPGHPGNSTGPNTPPARRAPRRGSTRPATRATAPRPG